MALANQSPQSVPPAAPLSGVEDYDQGGGASPPPGLDQARKLVGGSPRPPSARNGVQRRREVALACGFERETMVRYASN